jgi:hypothetical protein
MNPKLADIVRQIADDRYKEIISSAITHLSNMITANATDRKYTFDMGRWVGAKFNTSCTRNMFDDISKWLTDEGFQFDTQISRDAMALSSSINNRRVSTSFPSPPSFKRDEHSEHTFFITW